MKIFHAFLWICFLCGAAYLYFQKIYVAAHTDTSYSMLRMELADRFAVNEMLSSWKATLIDGRTLFHYARVSLWIDFFFIIGYTGSAIMISYNLMQREKTPVFNNVLRFCFPLAFLVGFSDVIENIVLLYNMHVFPTAGRIHSTFVPSIIKWSISALLVVAITIGALRAWISSR